MFARKTLWVKEMKKAIFNPFANDPLPFIEALISRALHNLQTCVPAIVKKVEDRNMVVVIPAVQQMNAEWQSVEWAEMRLPVLTPCGKNIALSVPLTAGDTGWIIAGDLDPSLFFKDVKKSAKQNILNRHEYQFGFFVPCALGDYKITADDGAFVIGTLDGETQFSVKDGEVNVKSKGALKITAKNVIIETDDSASVVIDGVNFKEHQHKVGTLSVPITSAQGSPSTISGSTGGVE